MGLSLPQLLLQLPKEALPGKEAYGHADGQKRGAKRSVGYSLKQMNDLCRGDRVEFKRKILSKIDFMLLTFTLQLSNVGQTTAAGTRPNTHLEHVTVAANPRGRRNLQHRRTR